MTFENVFCGEFGRLVIINPAMPGICVAWLLKISQKSTFSVNSIRKMMFENVFCGEFRRLVIIDPEIRGIWRWLVNKWLVKISQKSALPVNSGGEMACIIDQNMLGIQRDFARIKFSKVNIYCKECLKKSLLRISVINRGVREIRRDFAMGWLWLVGSLKLYVSFAEYRLFYRALLQKRPIILRSILIVITP